LRKGEGGGRKKKKEERNVRGTGLSLHLHRRGVVPANESHHSRKEKKAEGGLLAWCSGGPACRSSSEPYSGRKGKTERGKKILIKEPQKARQGEADENRSLGLWRLKVGKQKQRGGGAWEGKEAES